MQDNLANLAETQDAETVNVRYNVKTLPDSAKEKLTPEEVSFVYFLMGNPNLNLDELIERLNDEYKNSLRNGEIVWPRDRVKQFISSVAEKGIFEERAPATV